MNIGLTYDLRSEYLAQGYTQEQTAEFDSIDTVIAIEEVLRSLGHATDRIGGILALTQRLAAGDRWDLVFNIAEGMFGFAREAQVPALLDAYQIPYTFSDPLVLTVALHKATTKVILQVAGIPTPPFALIHKPADLDGVDLGWPVFAKPVAGGSSVGISGASKPNNRAELADVCAKLIGQFNQPVLVEAFLPGREVTVGVLGTGERARILAVMEVLLQPAAEPEVYSYDNKRNYHGRVAYQLADPDLADGASNLALRVWRSLGCRDAGRLDLRCDAAGNLQFLEVNPLAGLHPVDSDLTVMAQLAGLDHRYIIERILESAIERLALNPRGS